ncbi:hypothetical protein NLM31_12865 [Bradyrhizobium sp. CCGUVB4N]|uniref:hypothetical protein n=1 Tax=Bradyrhizobium sp. CCGUVB4N TaxID=2949631 RepID=UPI0020B2BCE8|nr:hypothetical protein [Bradyrhizobium sp. CCGUVB4N]MCP3381232.1 hypothetical protein [Bradyrhizobium sp. CCGUVB4N]
MKRSVCVLSVVLALAAPSATLADQPKVNQPKTDPLGGMIFSGANHCCVGIGTANPVAHLDVYQGELKLGSSGVGCADKNAGSIRYADKHLQLCDGTSWRNVSLDKAE